MGEIQSGADSSVKLTIDSTPKAARVVPYDSAGVYRGAKATYSGATASNVVAAAGAAMFFVIQASATKTIRLQRIIVSGFTLTSVAYNEVVAEKWSTAPTGGTITTLSQIPFNAADAAGTAALCQVYTVAPTEGTLVGTLDSRRILLQATTAAAAGIPATVMFDWRYQGGEMLSPTLRLNTNDCISVAFGSAPATAVTCAVEVEWTEE